MSTAAQVAAKLVRLDRDLNGPGRQRALKAGAAKAKELLLKHAERDMGGDLSLSNWRGSRANIGYELLGETRAEVTPRDSKGGAVWHVLEEGAGAHRITRKGGRGRGGRRALKIRGDFRRSVVWRPKSRGKKTWTEGVRASQAEVSRAVREETEKVIAEALRG